MTAAEIASIPQPPDHSALVAQALDDLRAERQPIIQVLDGLQSSALVNGDMQAAQDIEAAKQALRDITSLDLSQCETYEDMRTAAKLAYAQIVAQASPAVRLAFSEALA